MSIDSASDPNSGSLSPEEEERARIEREARRAELAQQPPAENSTVAGGMGFSGSGSQNYGSNNDSTDEAEDLIGRGIAAASDSPDAALDVGRGVLGGLTRGVHFVAEKTNNALGAASSQVTD